MQEQALRILEAMSGVDEGLLERSNATTRRRTPVWQYGGTWAAVVCAVMLCALVWKQNLLRGNMSGGMFNGASGSDGDESCQMSIAEANPKDCGDNINSIQADGVLPSEYSGSQEGASPSVPTGGEGSQNGVSPSVSPGGEGSQNGVSPSVSPGGEGSQNGVSPSVSPGGEGGQEGASPSVPTGGEGGQNGVSPSVSSGAAGNQDKAGGQFTEEFCGDSMGKVEQLTEEEARAMEILGEYIPNKIPKGYDFESACWSEDEGALSIGWSRGLDDIRLSVKQVKSCDIVDVNRTELYDVGRYDVPYGESVPKEYLEIFNDPVFAWEDMGLEVIQRRMRSYEDSGDTGTPRGNFGILFPDGVLLKFRGDGTAGQIWDMFQSLGL